MIIGIVGLGLIGGSFALAYKEADETVYAFDIQKEVLDYALLSGACDAVLTADNIGNCDLVLIAVYPEAALSYLREMAPYIGEKPIIIDCCGTKRAVCDEAFPLAAAEGFTFVGGHPMAGTQYSGFKYARANLFHRAPMVLVPADCDDIRLLDKIKSLLAPVGFGRISVTNAEAHDEMIAFTSQMAHVVSNAYVKSPTAKQHKGFSAGSYKDLTRVARLNPQMWAELFLDNRDHLLTELEVFIDNLEAYRKALQEEDEETLVGLLTEGSCRKKEIDGR